MKRFLFSLLFLTMWLPGLACADVMYNAPSKAMPCCPEKMHDTSTTGDVMLFKDCAKSDLQKLSNSPLLKGPVTQDTTFTILPAATVPTLPDLQQLARTRGPPPERLTADLTHPPILLTIPRLRI